MALPASSQLPDEIVKEILAPALYVSDKAFSNTSQKSNPFANYELSTSTILVVCKSWLRVATPLLYETVVLRSKAQAQAIAGVLKRNEQFDRFIKKLRVEGGYGAFVGEILQRSPNLSDLWISTTLYSNESVAGCLKGFQSVDVRRLIVIDDHLKASAIRKKVYEALAEAIRRGKPTIQKLQNAHYVSELEKLMRDDRGLYNKVVYESAKKDGSFSFDFAIFLSDSDSDDSLPETQTNVHKKDEDVLPAPLDPNWRPLVGASDTGKKEILSCILRHAASLSEQGTSVIRRGQTLQHFRAKLTLVSHEFNELATPFLYQAPILTGPKGLQALSQSRHAHHIKFLWLQSPYSTRNNANFLCLIFALLSRCSNLVLVSEARHLHALEEVDEIRNNTVPIPYQWSNFESDISLGPNALIALSKSCAGTLRHLHLNTGLASFKSQKEFTRVLNAPGQLRELRSVMMCGKFESVGDLTKLDVSAGRFPRDAFLHLERLVVDPDCTINKIFLYALCSAKLPALNWLRIGGDFPKLGLDPSIEKFLSVHGSKLIYLESTARLGGSFAYCTNVRIWLAICSDGWGSDDDFLCLHTDNLNPDPDITYALNNIMIPSYRFGLSEAEALLNMDLSRLTSLEKIHVDHLEWSKSQRDIDKSTWVPVAEAMVERWNIKFADHRGTAWVPRLKPVKPNRKK